MLRNGKFIKPYIEFDAHARNYAPMFRKKFSVGKVAGRAVIHLCGLGFGHFFLNGERITEDLFIAPVSNYSKTLWYNSYDVTDKLKEGDNIFAAVCGNGWYNEALSTAWDFDKADWRDTPKLIAVLEIDGQVALSTDGTWKCKCDPAVLCNQLRAGEFFDSRLYDEKWMTEDYADETWPYAKEDDNPPKGVFRPCTCEPIRECEVLSPIEIVETHDKKYIFDLGKNISGYIRLTINQADGDEIKIEYAEQMQEDGSRQLNDMQQYYHDSEFQVDRFVCCGREFTWSPRFVYHGFRYIVLTGIRDINSVKVFGVHVHQDVKQSSDFSCSNESVNQLFRIGQNATLCNMFYSLTDCPSREKLGWMNDAQASTHQILTDFEAERFFEKWFVDICDAMREDGQLPGIVPTGGWGYHWGNGPVSDGTLFEIPYRVYLHTGNDELLKKGLPFFKRYLNYLSTQENEKGELDFGLDDWAAPVNEDKVGRIFINDVLRFKYLEITILAMKRCHEATDDIEKQKLEQKTKIINRYIDETGRCIIDKQTSVAMLLYFDIFEEFAPLREQLKELIEKKGYHHDCGMVGLRYLYTALNKCSLQEYAMRIICAEGFPSYVDWLKDGATSLYERWNMTESKNHHMYSHFMSWLVNTILGIKPDINYPGFRKLDIDPFITEELDYAKGYCKTVNGRVDVFWKKVKGNVKVIIEVTEGIEAYYKGRRLSLGVNEFEYQL